MAIEFHDFSVQAKQILTSAGERFLEEAAFEIESAAKRNSNSRVDTGQLKGSWSYTVDKAAQEATVGSPLENAIWEEFGTGEYALHGDGRKGGWFIPAEKLTAKAKSKMQKVVIDGKEFYHTYGKKPNRTLQRAFADKKSVIERRARKIFGEMDKK